MAVPEGLDSCPECNLQFLDSNSLNLHRVRKHSSKQQAADLPCPICQGFKLTFARRNLSTNLSSKESVPNSNEMEMFQNLLLCQGKNGQV